MTSGTKADLGVCAHDNGTTWDVSEAKVLLWFFVLEGTKNWDSGTVISFAVRQTRCRYCLLVSILWITV